MLWSIGIPVGIQSSTDLLHFSEDLWKCGLLSLSPASLFHASHLLTLGVGSNSAAGHPSAEMRIKSSNIDTARLTRMLLLIRFWAKKSPFHTARQKLAEQGGFPQDGEHFRSHPCRAS